jgi:Zn-finger nucleic acid-binding protein
MATTSRTKTPARKKTDRSRVAAGGPDAEFNKTRARLDKNRAKRREKLLWAHYWLLCPKCGGDMFVQETLGIRYEVCRDCKGIAIDGDEVALLLAHIDPGKALQAILKKSKKPDTTEI